MADFKFDPSTLAQLSAPGFNRNIGTGDVVPYFGKEPDRMQVEDAPPATAGVSFDPGHGGAPVIPNSFLNNLSLLQPILDQIRQTQQAAAIPSGQGNAQAQPLPGAIPGTSSPGPSGALAPAGAPLSSVAPSLAHPSTAFAAGDVASASGGEPGISGVGDPSGNSGVGEGAVGEGAVGEGAVGEGAVGEGAVGEGAPGDAGAPGGPGDPGDSGDGGGW